MGKGCKGVAMVGSMERTRPAWYRKSFGAVQPIFKQVRDHTDRLSAT